MRRGEQRDAALGELVALQFERTQVRQVRRGRENFRRAVVQTAAGELQRSELCETGISEDANCIGSPPGAADEEPLERAQVRGAKQRLRDFVRGGNRGKIEDSRRPVQCEEFISNEARIPSFIQHFQCPNPCGFRTVTKFVQPAGVITAYFQTINPFQRPRLGQLLNVFVLEIGNRDCDSRTGRVQMCCRCFC